MPPPLPECASALRFRAAPSPRLASTTRAFYPPNRYSRTPRTAAPVSTLRLLTSWLLLTYPVASDLQRGGLCSREMLIVEPLQLQTSSECSFWSKARPAARESCAKHRVLACATRSSGTPLCWQRFYGASRKFHPQLYSQHLHSRHAATAVEIFFSKSQLLSHYKLVQTS